MSESNAPARPDNTFERQGDARLLEELQLELQAEVRRLNAGEAGLDLFFLVFLRRHEKFGYFRFGPLTIDVRLVEDLVYRTLAPGDGQIPGYSDDFVRFSRALVEEVRRSGQRRIDDLHFLLAFMRVNEGLPGRVFGELGIPPEQVEAFARTARPEGLEGERLYSPEEAAAYLGVHVQTVRAWIRTGRLRASRLAGQRALRIRASDLSSVLEPVLPGEDV